MISAWKKYGRLGRFMIVFGTLFFGIQAVVAFAIGQSWAAALLVALIAVYWLNLLIFARRLAGRGAC